MPLFEKKQTLKETFFAYAESCVTPAFAVDGENKHQLESAIQIILENKTGVIIQGNPGGGKSLFFDLMMRLIHPKSPRSFVKRSAFQTMVDFNTKGYALFNEVQKKNIWFEDLGTENKGKFYGDALEAFEAIIQLRYQAFKNHGVKTHFCTNLSESELYERYGHRCESRLKEMCQFVLLAGKEDSTDRRTLKTTVTFVPVHHQQILTKEQKDFNEYYAARKEAISKIPYVETQGEVKGMGTLMKQQLDEAIKNREAIEAKKKQ